MSGYRNVLNKRKLKYQDAAKLNMAGGIFGNTAAAE